MKLILGIHNHQPVGNFDHVIAEVYEQSYLPFLERLEAHPHIRLCMHHTGPLWEWIEANRPEYLERLATLVDDGRLEILGGAFYEPILPAIGEADRLGQIQLMTRKVAERFGTEPHGMWLAERVWEPQLTRSLAAAGVRYVLLDDYHFIQSGIAPEELTERPLATEELGSTVALFPISEKLRYLIPFQEPKETIDVCRELHEQDPGGMLVMVDDGEKFGAWPDTYDWVYNRGWLERFFAAVSKERDWLELVTPSEMLRARPPQRRVYLPPGSYFEMTEWALPVAAAERFLDLVAEAERNERWDELRPYLRGGFWRQFLQRYDESAIMYQRALLLHADIERARQGEVSPAALETARMHLWRAQCNCAYWHGVFGGLYLPHLRHAVYENLIRGTGAIAGAVPHTGMQAVSVAGIGAWDLRLRNRQLDLFVAPSRGCSGVGLEESRSAWNLFNTLKRRREAYHRRIENTGTGGDHDPASGHESIHDRAVDVAPELREALAIDPQARFCWQDRLLHSDVTFAESIEGMAAADGGDFAGAPYRLIAPDRTLNREIDALHGWHEAAVSTLVCERHGEYRGRDGLRTPVTVNKSVTLVSDAPRIELVWRLHNDGDRPVAFLFTSEWNLALLQGQTFALDQDGNSEPLALEPHPLTETLTLQVPHFGAILRWRFSRACPVWVHEVRTVSQAESGFELNYQGHMILPLFEVQLEPQGEARLGTSFSVTG